MTGDRQRTMYQNGYRIWKFRDKVRVATRKTNLQSQTVFVHNDKINNYTNDTWKFCVHFDDDGEAIRKIKNENKHKKKAVVD